MRATATSTPGLDRRRLAALREREAQRLETARPGSSARLGRAQRSMPNGVPMSWMRALYSHTPPFATAGSGATFSDVDGHEYVDFNVADMSMILGYAPPLVFEAVARAASRGTHFLLPCDDATIVSERLAERTGLPCWQYTLTATQANVEAIRLARVATGRSRIVIFDGKYHGHVEETMVASADGGQQRDEALGLSPAVTRHTRVLPFNDVEALRAELASGEVACVLLEPALTNCTLLLPAPGYLAAVRALTRETGTVLIHDEAHTFLLAYGGLTREWELAPDVMTFGKGLGTGVPFAAYGVTRELAAVLERHLDGVRPEQPGIALGGTTFASNLSLAAARAALEHYLTPEGYARCAALGSALADGIDRVVAKHGLPWRAHRLFARSGYCLFPEWPRTADEAHASIDREFIDSRRLYLANRGYWDAIWSAGPCVSFAHERGHVDGYLQVVEEYFEEVVGD
jgi:glutamate-1-semialdehyde aminotransferase